MGAELLKERAARRCTMLKKIVPDPPFAFVEIATFHREVQP